jgi:alkylhydroperoxidase/carboxymuconolactone decarboxylase family protein YurZ
MAISIAIRCEPCIRAYAQMAYDKGVTQEEFIEFLEVAMTMQGCAGERALKAWAVYKECHTGGIGAAAESCCAH